MRVPEKQTHDIADKQRQVTLPRWLLMAALLCITLVAIGAAMTRAGADGDKTVDRKSEKQTVRDATDHGGDDVRTGDAGTGGKGTRFAVEIRKPSGPPRVVTDLRDVNGREVTVACSTCHTNRQPNHQNRTVTDLDEFHGGIVFSHGKVSCLSCHNERDYDALRLADGSRVEFTDVMKLCAQCHGPQMKSYEHGAHGGMSGYWDLSRGPRLKNNCVDCHNPHAPQFPRMRPMFKPRDRFLEQPGTKH